MKKIEVYVTLLEEGTDTIRATDAVDMGNGTFKLLPTPSYDPEDEIWEFLPGSIVKIKQAHDFHGRPVLLAFEKVG
ncbi:MAG: hypothetical protein EBQ96_08675 [Proteobacteria bacterium]|nr:hypothetical protein [Pseudomonadota bacterium]